MSHAAGVAGALAHSVMQYNYYHLSPHMRVQVLYYAHPPARVMSFSADVAKTAVNSKPPFITLNPGGGGGGQHMKPKIRTNIEM